MKNQKEKEENRTVKREKRGANGMILQIVLSVIAAGVGGLLLFVPGIQTKELCYIFTGGMIAAALVLIIRFFVSKAYNRLYDYSFSLGILFLILGVCGLLRIDALVSHFQLTCGMLLLVIGVMILQGMVELNVVDNLFWIVLMIFTTVTLVGSVLLTLDVQPVIALLPNFTYWLLFGAGIASLLSLLIVSLVLFLHRRKMRRREEEGYPEDEDMDGEEEDVPQETPAAAEIPYEAPASPVPEEIPASFAQDTGVAAGETQIYPPIGGYSSAPAQQPYAGEIPASAQAASVENAVEQSLYAALEESGAAPDAPAITLPDTTAELPEIVPPESL